MQLTGMPGQMPGNQSFHIGIDGESRNVECRGAQHQERAGGDNGPPVTRAEIDNPDNR
jgi:hypothetical protein